MIDVTCAIIEYKNKVLVTQRSEVMKLPLKWEFPGGKLEIGETDIECIKREIKEELNIEIEVKNKLSVSVFNYEDFNISLIPFIAEYVSGEIKLSEHKTYKWLSNNELLELDWADADLPILKEYLSI